MKTLCVMLLLSCAFVLAQNNDATNSDTAKNSKGDITVTGCVSRANGDYTHMKQDLT